MSIPRQRTAAEYISVSAALELTSWEAGYYCRNCQDCIISCFNTPGEHISYGMSCYAADLLEIKRAEERTKKSSTYAKLVASIARYGLRTPIGVCAQGTCLTDGHHRLAALLDLGVQDVPVQVVEFEDGCSCQELAPTHLQAA